MRLQARKYFYQLDSSEFSDHIILLDVQGTLIGANHWHIDERTLKTARGFAVNNQIYLLSNYKNIHKIALVAKQLGVPYIKSPLYKPDKRLLECIPNTENKKMVMIGDLFLTDVLFSKTTGMRGIHVRHMRHKSDTFIVKVLYCIDDAVAVCVRMLHFLVVKTWRKPHQKV